MSTLSRRAWALVKPDVRASHARVRWHLRHADVGPRARINGRIYATCRDLRIGADLLVLAPDRTVRLGGNGSITIGDRVLINAGAMIVARESVTIGNDVALAYDVMVTDSNDHGLTGGPAVTRPVVIEDGAWICARAMILPGVTIGARSVVAAGSVVIDDVPPDTLVAGQPAVMKRALDYPPGVVRAWHDE